MKTHRKIRAPGETFLAYLGLALLPWLPRRALVGLASFFGNLGYSISGRTRRIALANLDVAYGDELGHTEKIKIARESFGSFALVVLDLFWFAWRTGARIRKYVEFDESCDASFDLKPAVCVTGHIGNWELIGHAVAFKDPPFLSVAAPLRNPSVDRMITRLRQGSPQQVAYKAGAVRAAIKALREGGRVGMLLDQNILPSEGGQFVPFFGLPAPISSMAAKLALRLDLPITMMFCLPGKDGRYICHSPEPMVLEEGSDEKDGTARVARRLEEEIRRNPGGWLWMYKRWRVIPPGSTDVDRYPFYADRQHIVEQDSSDQPEGDK